MLEKYGVFQTKIIGGGNLSKKINLGGGGGAGGGAKFKGGPKILGCEPQWRHGCCVKKIFFHVC